MKSSLDTYAAKRSFDRTPEPAPSWVPREGPLLFVVQQHAASHMHYDLRLEIDGVLKSWAVPKGPTLKLGEKRMAVETEDHPFEYASFEGVIPAKEYGAGRMIVWDCGVYSPDEDQTYLFHDREQAQQLLRDGLAKGKLSFFLRGTKLKGSFALVRTSTAKQWLLLKHRDRFATDEDVLLRDQSLLSGSVVAEVRKVSQRIAAAQLVPHGPVETVPAKFAPMLAEVGETLRSDPAWRYEPKLDGYRVVALMQDGKVRLMSRGGLDITAAFPEVVEHVSAQAVNSMILDGEIIAYDAEGHPSFNALQKRAQLKTPKEIERARASTPVVYVCFDLLHFAGLNLRSCPYAERRRYLEQCLLTSTHVQLVLASKDAEQLYEAAIALGFEGIVAKREDSLYQPGRRTAHWLKIKTTQSAEFVIGGYTQGRGGREALGALLLGFWQDKELQYVGHVGSGLSEERVAELQLLLEGLKRKTCPFKSKPALHRPTTWLEPKLVAEVKFEDRTPDGMLRAPVFLRLRDDMSPGDIKSAPKKRGRSQLPASTHLDDVSAVLEQLASDSKDMTLDVAGQRIKLTNLDREYWPADKKRKQLPITKREFIRYLAAVSPYMLPHLHDRPLTMIRMPEGIDGERFYQKHWEQKLPDFVETITIFSESKDEKQDYILANNLPTLLWLGQVGTLEFHIWHSRAKVEPDSLSKSEDTSSSLEALEASVLNYPDYLVFDIDPYIYSGKEGKGEEPEFNTRAFKVGKEVAFWLHALLDQMSLRSIVKTSGKTGLHVFVPIERSLTFDEVRHVCEMVGRHLMSQHPKEITMEWAVVKRTGKIFMDYNMNVRGKTLNVAYSPRGVPGAPVSMPLSWDELKDTEPMDFTMRNVLSILEKTGDRWHDALTTKQDFRSL